MVVREILTGYIKTYIFCDPDSNFCAIISLEANAKYPALGGCRLAYYPSIEAAILEAECLCRAMGHKAAASGLPYSGGKAVIIKPMDSWDRSLILQRFGECVESLQGRYITTIDSGTSPEDMSYISRFTQFITGTIESERSFGSTSQATALGVFIGIKAAARYRLHTDSVSTLHVAIQGLGEVGYRLATLLAKAGAALTLCDAKAGLALHYAQELGGKAVEPDEIYKVDCDIFSPCALGQVINARTVPMIKAKIVAGAANEQLMDPGYADLLKLRDILYVPDYLINAGGLIHLAYQMQGKCQADSELEIAKIDQRVLASISPNRLGPYSF
ncbi:MAG: Glu/Leu/Phe/Val dehydrogenase dimerization domain-containing protein [Gammaproteobacteria bacterium]|nr:Glu/Leu/Phe/Val dehydrogenase dimerization domain-containing protein [Gammaproteobacteria bacterium]